MALDISLTQFSWVRYGSIKSTEVPSGIDLTNPLVVSWFGMFQSPDLADRDGDIEYTVQDGDRLDKLSLYYYGTPFLWWVIAAKNQIDLPDIELYGGKKIIITDPDYVVSQIGGKQIQVEP